MNSSAAPEVTVLDLPFFDVPVRDFTLGSEVARLFEQNSSLPGVIVLDPAGFRGMVSRNQFFQRLARPFGLEVYSTRPITAFLDSLTNPPLLVPAETTIQNAAVACLARPVEDVYDPFVIVAPDGSLRLVDFLALMLKQTELLKAAQIEAHAQRLAAVSASNAKSEFLANMSHELRTPLTAVIGYGEILIEDVNSGQLDQAVPRLQSIVSAGLHLLEMINAILDLSKIEARKMDLYLTTFPLADFLSELTDGVLPLMKKNGNSFQVDAGTGLGDMHTDEAKLRQSLINLLGNAAKFTHGGQVALAIRREPAPAGDLLVFRVSDTGIGMDESQMARLFESFYQADSSISRRYGGTGLGLALTKQFCTLLGGELAVESALHRGTTFTMKIPARCPEKETGSDPAPPPPVST
jgi:signal transduction histidine kinase